MYERGKTYHQTCAQVVKGESKNNMIKDNWNNIKFWLVKEMNE